LDACVTLSHELAAITAEAPGRPILILVDTIGQKMSRSDELLGLSQAIGHVAQNIVLARQNGHRVVTLLLGKAAAAAFIALVLMAERVVALPEAEPAVLTLPAIARVTKMPLAELERLSRTTPVLTPGLAPMQQLGAVQEVLPAGPALKQRLETLLLADHLDAPMEAPAAQPYRALIARVQSLVAGR
jgi:malonate decarboxylase gamma subunit